MTLPRIPSVALLLFSILHQPAFSSKQAEALPVVREQRFEGAEILVDDEWFDGCFHDAFEGAVVVDDNGKIKQGTQAIQRTKGSLTGAGTGHSKFTLQFYIEEAELKNSVEMVLSGIDDTPEPRNRLAVTVNGHKITEGLEFPNNQAEGNDRYLIGWKEESLTIPAGVLKKGDNRIEVENTTSCFKSHEWNYVFIDWIGLKFGKPAKLAVRSHLPTPVLYHGLLHGAEVNAWPAVNFDNRICLLEKTPIQTTFFLTLPKPAQEPDAKKGKMPDINLHLETDADLTVLSGDGSEIAASAPGSQRVYTIPLKRLVKYETPHPAQAVTLYLRGGAPFEGKELKAWFSLEGKAGLQRVYPLRNVTLAPLAGREGLKFDLGIWGGQIPTSSPALHEYIVASKGAGFNQMFTGDDQELNTALKKEGIKVFPRFGWFGHQFKVTEELKPFAAIDAKGEPMMKDFCPLVILEKQDDPEIGKFFERARKVASQTEIDGICVDYETAPVWCYCERCLEKFQQEEGGNTPKREDVISGAPLEHAYLQFGRRRNRDLLARVREIIREQNDRLQYHALASACDIPSYWYDGRVNARHSIRELAKFADAIYASCYFYEIAGGMKSVLPVIETVRNFARSSQRDVGTYIISPISTTISEFPRYRGHG